MVLDIIVDKQAIILYSLKYGKVKCCCRIGRAGAGQSPRCLPAPGAGGTGRSAGGPSRGSTQARAEYVDVSLRPAAWSWSRVGAARRSLDDLCSAIRHDERAAGLLDRELLPGPCRSMRAGSAHETY